MSLTNEFQIMPTLCTIFLMRWDTNCLKKRERIFSVTFYFSKFVSKQMYQNIVSHVCLDFVLAFIHMIVFYHYRYTVVKWLVISFYKSTKNGVQNKYDIE